MKLQHLIKSIANNFTTKSKPSPKPKYYQESTSFANKGTRGYATLVQEGFVNNVVANRAINMIAKSASAVELLLYRRDINGLKQEIAIHPAKNILNKPNGRQSGSKFIEFLITYFLISGNAYVYVGRDELSNTIQELQLLRPDRIKVKAKGGTIEYEYTIDGATETVSIDEFSGFGDIVHFKNFHPLDDLLGLSPLESAKTSIEQHNECLKWNNSLLQQGARPNGAFIIKNKGFNDRLSPDEVEELTDQIRRNVGGSSNAGKTLVLQGGLEWQEMNITPKDMDFIETKNSAARDISLALGVPPQLLGIKGDNTYNTLSESRLVFWEETVLPILNQICEQFSAWFSNHFGEELIFTPNLDSISALNGKRQMLWDNLKNSDFLTVQEKRQMLGFDASVTQTPSNEIAPAKIK